MEIRLHDTVEHIPTGRTGEYVEHANIGGGYMIRLKDGELPAVIGDKYENFRKVESD